MRPVIFTTLATLALVPASTVRAQDSTNPVEPTSGGARRTITYGGFEPAARTAWLADCHAKIAAQGAASGAKTGGGGADYTIPASDPCESYLADYYNAYTKGRYTPYSPDAKGEQSYIPQGYSGPGYDVRRYGADYTHAPIPTEESDVSYVSQAVVQPVSTTN